MSNTKIRPIQKVQQIPIKLCDYCNEKGVYSLANYMVDGFEYGDKYNGKVLGVCKSCISERGISITSNRVIGLSEYYQSNLRSNKQ